MNVLLSLFFRSRSMYRSHFIEKNGNVILIVAKIIDDMKAAGESDMARRFMDSFNKKFQIESISSGPEKCVFLY